MMTDCRNHFWWITGSQRMYGPEALTQVADDATQIVRALDQDDDAIWRILS